MYDPEELGKMLTKTEDGIALYHFLDDSDESTLFKLHEIGYVFREKYHIASLQDVRQHEGKIDYRK